MDEEIKKAYLSWSEKGVCYLNSMYAYDTMVEVDQALQRCDEILGEAALGIGYTSRQSDIDRLLDGRCTLRIYIDALNYYVDDKLDQPLRQDFKKNATETISRIHLEDFEVDNTLGLTENNYIPGGMGYSGTMIEQEKGKLTFADFIGTSDGKAEGNGFHMAFTNGSVEGFAEIFAGQYEAMLASGMLGEDNELTQQEFLEQFYKQGEFTHDSSNPFLNFVSSVLDITIIKPIIEACTGEDLITGEDLTDLERGLKVVFAVVDLVTLGAAISATKISEMGFKGSIQAFGKTALIDFAGNTAACGVGALGEAFDWPMPITIMLSLAAGITVSIAGNKMLFKNEQGITIGEKALSDEQMKTVGETIENGNYSNGKYTGGRTEQELKALAEDPAHSGSTRTIDIEKGQHEARIGLELEERGFLKNITRDPTGKAEFIDGNGQAWDIKSFNSNYKPNKGGFRLDKAMNTIKKSLAENENVIVDTSNMSPEHIIELTTEIRNQGLENNILFWP